MTAQAIKQMRDEDIIGFHRRLPAFRAGAWTGGASRSSYNGETSPRLHFRFYLNSKRFPRRGQITHLLPILTLIRSNGWTHA